MNNLKTLAIGYLNIQGQSRLNQAKQNQLDHILKEYKCDILHLQETNILEDTFELCPHIANNYQILAQNNEIGFGTCSLVHNKLEVSNEVLHPNGRLISFDVGSSTMLNIYAPSGSDFNAKNQREDLFGHILPNVMLGRKNAGVAGGDWNTVNDPLDCTNFNPAKASPNLKKLTTLLNWKDTFRELHPHTKAYSHTYNRNMADLGIVQGASRLDRSYTWGRVNTIDSQYVSVSFSDHFLHLVTVELPEPFETKIHQCPPFFKISPEVAKDEDFKIKVEQIIKDWSKVKEKLPLQRWWDLVKKDVRGAAKEVKRERSRTKMATLNYLMLAQTYLSTKVSKGNLTMLPKLKEIQIKINAWFDDEAEKVKLHSKLNDIQESEKVRIFHHEKLYKTQKKCSILKLQTPEGIISGHQACANFLNNESQALLGLEAILDQSAQDTLLEAVQPVFTEQDNKMLEAEISDEEIKSSLQNSNIHASPGSDSLTYLTYLQCWSSLGSPLCQVIREIIKTGKPTTSMTHSFQVFSPKQGKSSSILPKDKRRLALLNSDYKILTGVLAARLKKTENHTLSEHQYAAGTKRITHCIAHARDMVQNTTNQQKGVAIVATDFKQAFDLCSISWVWRVLEKKNCSSAYLSVLKNIYEYSPNYVINIINNEQQVRILNRRKNIKQGDKTSSLFYCFAMEGVLLHLNNKLQGHVYHKLPTLGPKHPKLGGPNPVEARQKAMGYIDDVKAVVTSVQEFTTLDNALQLYEKSSGSELHRDPTTKKCQILTLGRWAVWKQEDSPLNFMSIVDQLCFLGVKLCRSSAKTRAVNGDDLTKRVKAAVAVYKHGRHSPLICRPYTINTFVMSKISYRSSIINLRSQDINNIQSVCKQWINKQLLVKPQECLLFREEDQGGLGLIHTESRCLANLTRTFIQLSHPYSKYCSLFLNSLFRCYILNELEPGKIKRPPYYTESFFNHIKEAIQDEGLERILSMSTREWQRRLTERSTTHLRDPLSGISDLIHTNLEKSFNNITWPNAWFFRRIQGLTPDQKSWLFLFCNNLLPTNERLNRIGKLQANNCSFCGEIDTRQHILNCPNTIHLVKPLQEIIESCAGSPTSNDHIACFDLSPPSTLRLPLAFISCEILRSVFEYRISSKTLNLNTLGAAIKAASKVFLQSKKYNFANSIVELWVNSFFVPDSST